MSKGSRDKRRKMVAEKKCPSCRRMSPATTHYCSCGFDLWDVAIWMAITDPDGSGIAGAAGAVADVAGAVGGAVVDVGGAVADVAGDIISSIGDI